MKTPLFSVSSLRLRRYLELSNPGLSDYEFIISANLYSAFMNSDPLFPFGQNILYIVDFIIQ